MNPYWQKRCERCGNAYLPFHKHHIYRRVNNREAIALLCYKCHLWIHSHPAEAYKEGFYERLTTVDKDNTE